MWGSAAAVVTLGKAEAIGQKSPHLFGFGFVRFLVYCEQNAHDQGIFAPPLFCDHVAGGTFHFLRVLFSPSGQSTSAQTTQPTIQYD